MADVTPFVLRSFAEHTPGGILFALDRAYRYVFFNGLHRAIMQQIWGVEIAEGTDMLAVIGRPDDREKARANFDRALAGEAFTVVEAYGDEALQRSYWQNVYAPVVDAAGAVIGVTVQVTDVTARERSEALIRDRQDELGRLVAERTAALEEKIAEIQSLSAPIIQVWDGILVVPLIGTFAAEQAARTTHAVLEELQRSRSRCLLLDITGMHTVDASAAEHLLRLVHAARLLGSACALVGVRPGVAATLVEHDVPLAGLRTHATLRDGLREALARGVR
jgi:rsbT co-antagonist protein RsbR